MSQLRDRGTPEFCFLHPHSQSSTEWSFCGKAQTGLCQSLSWLAEMQRDPQAKEDSSRKRRASDSNVAIKDLYSSRQAAVRQKQGLQHIEEELQDVNALLASQQLVLVDLEDQLVG